MIDEIIERSKLYKQVIKAYQNKNIEIDLQDQLTHDRIKWNMQNYGVTSLKYLNINRKVIIDREKELCDMYMERIA